MKDRLTILFLTTSLFSSAVALAEQRITTGMNVKGFIGSIHQADSFYENAKIIEARGYRADWADAIAGEGTIISDDGNIHITKTFYVPFCNSIGIRRIVIIGGILKPQNSVDIHQFITIADSLEETAAPGIGAGEVEQDSAIKPLIGAIRAGDRSSIWTIILGGTITSTSIHTAFVSSGSACNSAPAWFPEKSIWYAATCPSTNIREPQGKEDDQEIP